MLPKNLRLNLKHDFKRVAAGKKVETRYLRLFIRPVQGMTKVGIALSSKNFKKAHDRNRARRLTSKAFESIYQNLPTKMEIIALPKAGILEVKSGEVAEDIKAILKNEIP